MIIPCEKRKGHGQTDENDFIHKNLSERFYLKSDIMVNYSAKFRDRFQFIDTYHFLEFLCYSSVILSFSIYSSFERVSAVLDENSEISSVDRRKDKNPARNTRSE